MFFQAAQNGAAVVGDTLPLHERFNAGCVVISLVAGDHPQHKPVAGGVVHSGPF